MPSTIKGLMGVKVPGPVARLIADDVAHTFSGAVDLTGTVSVGGTALSATAAELNRVADASARIVNTTATTLTITEALHDGKIVTISSAAPIAITLPAATGSGARFVFVLAVAATATAHTIKVANTADAIAGVSLVVTTTSSNTEGWATTATDDTITINGTTKGGVKGDIIEIIDVASALFHVNMRGSATGTEATPFSATV